MGSSNKLKSLDFYRKIPRDLTEASLSGGGLSIVAALAIIFLFGMELSHYFTMSMTTSVVVDKTSDGDFLRMDFNISFPALSCEFASVDVSDVLGTNRLNVTKTVRKFPIDSRLRPTGSEFHSGSFSHLVKHDEEDEEVYAEGAVPLNMRSFDQVSHRFPILVVNFFAPWCYWSNRLRPSWEKAAQIITERYDPEMDGRILLAKVDCTEEIALCRRNYIQGFPSIRIYRRGSDVREDHGHHEHESYYGDRDTESLVKTMEGLVAPISLEPHRANTDNNTRSLREATKGPAPSSGGCRVEGFLRVKKVPGNLVIAARSQSHSFDASEMNMSHVISHLSFGKKITRREMSHMIEHYLQVVKTEVIMSSSDKLEEYEYTAHSSLIHSINIPVAKFHFEISPMQVRIMEDSKSFSHFITNVCAIIGGVFTVAGILDSILHNTIRLIKKFKLGKDF